MILKAKPDFQEHLKDCKVSKTIPLLRKLQKNINWASTASFIRPHLDYGHIIFYKLFTDFIKT